jgi:transposase
MPRPYSDDLRERVIEAVEAGASRREAAKSFNPCPSSAVKWLQRWRDCGSAKAKPTGGSRSRLEEHAEVLLALVAEQPDLTLDEIVAAMRKRRIEAAAPQSGDFLRDTITTFKKSLHAAEQQRPDVALARRRWRREQFMFDPARLVFIDETAANTKMVRLRGRCPRGERLVASVACRTQSCHREWDWQRDSGRSAVGRSVPIRHPRQRSEQPDCPPRIPDSPAWRARAEAKGQCSKSMAKVAVNFSF